MEKLTKEKVVQVVSEYTDVPVADIMSLSRKQSKVEARYICMYIMRKVLSLSQNNIGIFFSRDHSTVIHAVRTIENLIEIYPIKRYHVEKLEQQIRKMNAVTEPTDTFGQLLWQYTMLKHSLKREKAAREKLQEENAILKAAIFPNQNPLKKAS